MKDNYLQYGFETLGIDSLDEYRGKGIHLRHQSTGAEVYKVDASDDENLFSFTFRTPPYDHTGVAHILEHSVLCGSEHYPLKDPFLVLLKGSAHTFLNAMTYPDKTVYPAASTVKADFLNLLRVYGDAVFFPQLKKEAFEQEGHRLEFDDEGRLVRAGIVLNEMKGSYSSAESVAGDWTLRSLFPDTPYRWDSGGDPEHIPSLRYEDFKAFHENYYHPSNSRIFLYGNHNLDEVLSILDGEFLSHFSRREISSDIPVQSGWSEPRRMEAFWPSAPGEPVHRKSTISMNWLLGDTTDPEAVLSSQVLSFILLGHSGSPLQKAIIDSGLGEDLSPVSGLETDLRQMVFSAALRGTDPEKMKDFENLVTGVFEDILSNGLDSDLVEGALRSVEFRGREIRGGSPFGMRLMNRALRGWLHNRSPLESLVFEAPMKKLRSQVKPGFFEEIIRRDILENNHRSTVVVSPDPGLQGERDARERRSLDNLRKTMGSMDELKASLEKLEIFQDTPDSPEDLARIPFLSREDLPRDVRLLSLKEGRQGDVSWFLHETFTNGVNYLEMAFDMENLNPDFQYWMPLFGRALTDVGLPGMAHDEVARELAMKTGSLGCSLEAAPVHPDAGGGISRRLFLHLKALNGQWEEALELTFRLLLSADFSDVDRVKDLLLELRNDFRSAIVPSGHVFASLRAASKHSPASAWEDLWYGVEQLKFLQATAEDEAGPKRASEALISIRKSLIRKGNLSLVVTSDAERSENALNTVLKSVLLLSEGKPDEKGRFPLFRHETTGEALSTASAVSFSALSLPAPILGTPGHARSGLLAHILRTGYLWEHIRMKGGAYGALVSISGMEGTFTFSTYRDPVIVPSLAAFRKSLEWAVNELEDNEVNLAVIGSVGKELRPLSPGERGSVAFKRRLYGITDETRQKRRDFQLTAVAADLRREAEKYLESWEGRSVSVIAGAGSLDEAAGELPELAESRVVLPS
jgi:Zn-dependent M16 (insulinase) family peptidase